MDLHPNVMSSPFCMFFNPIFKNMVLFLHINFWIFFKKNLQNLIFPYDSLICAEVVKVLWYCWCIDRNHIQENVKIKTSFDGDFLFVLLPWQWKFLVHMEDPWMARIRCVMATLGGQQKLLYPKWFGFSLEQFHVFIISPRISLSAFKIQHVT